MIQEYIKIWDKHKTKLEAVYKSKHPDSYAEIVKNLIELLSKHLDDYNKPDVTRIHQIDDGYYQGTLVFVIAAEGYQPNDYWYVKICYGSCSVCDTLQGISEYSSDVPTGKQIADYMTLTLHILQGLRKMNDDKQPTTED